MSWSALFASGPDSRRAPARAVARLFDALTDPLRRERAAVAALSRSSSMMSIESLVRKVGNVHHLLCIILLI